METRLLSLNSDTSPTPRISMAQLRNVSPTVTLPQLSLWDECFAGIASSRPPHFDIYEWLGDACLNFSGHYFPDLPSQEAKRFADFFKRSSCHTILVKHCYIGNDKRTMDKSIESHLLKIGEKAYSDYLEFYVGILLKSIRIDRSRVWDIIREIVSVGLLYYINENKLPKEMNDSAQLSYNNIISTLSDIPSISDSPSSSLHSSINLSVPSQSIEFGQNVVAFSKTFPNQESVSKSSSTPLSMNKNVESPNPPVSSTTESLTQTSIHPNRRKRKKKGRRTSRPCLSQIAVAYVHFIFTSIIVDEILTLSDDEQDSLYRRGNILRTLIKQLRTDLENLIIEFSIPDQDPTSLSGSKRTREGQIFEYLTTNALHSEIFPKILRDAKPVQECLDNFRRQLKTIIQICRNHGTFKGAEGDDCTTWKIIRSDGIKCFEGPFLQLRMFLLNPDMNVLQNHRNKNRRKLGESQSRRKRSRKNSQSRQDLR